MNLVDLMDFKRHRCERPMALALGAQSLGVETLEAALDHQLGSVLPRWDRMAPTGLYASLARPLLNCLLLCLATPIAFAVCLPIVLVNLIAFRDPRLVFFTQERVGRYGRVFRIWKFRTMRPVHGCEFEAWSAGDQNRVTAFGRFLRSTHLDEVPQIWNILLGDMDFIGPRPEMVAINDWACREVPGFERRLAVRPGITGLAQITQGYAGQCHEAYLTKLQADERYIRELSLAGDVSIVARTVLWMARGRGWKWKG